MHFSLQVSPSSVHVLDGHIRSSSSSHGAPPYAELADFQYIPALPGLGEPLFKKRRPEDGRPSSVFQIASHPARVPFRSLRLVSSPPLTTDVLHEDFLDASIENCIVPQQYCTTQPREPYK
jgi:hypothetical protein